MNSNGVMRQSFILIMYITVIMIIILFIIII